jgi:hypothetical protein
MAWLPDVLVTLGFDRLESLTYFRAGIICDCRPSPATRAWMSWDGKAQLTKNCSHFIKKIGENPDSPFVGQATACYPINLSYNAHNSPGRGMPRGRRAVAQGNYTIHAETVRWNDSRRAFPV